MAGRLAVDGRTCRFGPTELGDRERPDLVNLEPLAACPALEVLDLGGLCPALENLSALTRCPKLSSADLSSSRVSNLAPLRGCPRLQSLALKFTPLVDVSALSGLADLRFLDLAFTSVRDVAALGNLLRLETLTLQGTKVKSVSPLAACGQLSYLCLHGALSLTDIGGLEQCAALTTLDIRKGWELNEWDDHDALCPLPAAFSARFDVQQILSGLYHLLPRRAAPAAAAGAPGAVGRSDVPLLDIGRIATSGGGSVPYSPRVFSAGLRGTPSPRG